MAGKHRAYRDRPTYSVLSKASVAVWGDGSAIVGQFTFSVVLCAWLPGFSCHSARSRKCLPVSSGYARRSVVVLKRSGSKLLKLR